MSVRLPLQVSPLDACRLRRQGLHAAAGDGQDGSEIALLELFCNPNAYSTAFDARVLISLKTQGGLAVTTEGRLSAVKSDVDTFLEQAAVPA